MRKIILILIAFLAFTTFAFAQTTIVGPKAVHSESGSFVFKETELLLGECPCSQKINQTHTTLACQPFETCTTYVKKRDVIYPIVLSMDVQERSFFEKVAAFAQRFFKH